MNKVLWMSFALAIFTFLKCSKNENNVPLTRVDISVNINQPAYFNLTAIGGWEYLQGGSMGLLVYRYSQDEIRAFDRHSTYRPEDRCRVEVDSSNLFAVDPCSGSRFLIIDGSVERGPAGAPLQQYQTNFNGNILQIYN